VSLVKRLLIFRKVSQFLRVSGRINLFLLADFQCRNNSIAPDLKAPCSLALGCHVRSDLAKAVPNEKGEQWRLVMNTPPEMSASIPENYYWRARYSPSKKVASEQYHSINVSYLIDEQDLQHALRWTTSP
jgi:hypothetical protein